MTRVHGRIGSRAAAGGLLLVASALGLWWLWPNHLGGATSIVVVAGHSMEPTFHNGDLVIARQAQAYHPGDIVVVQVPTPSHSPALIIHRLMGIGPDRHIATQGDNRAQPDTFDVTTTAIVGKAVVVIPAGGTILWLLSRWWMLAITAGLLVTILLWPAMDIYQPNNAPLPST